MTRDRHETMGKDAEEMRYRQADRPGKVVVQTAAANKRRRAKARVEAAIRRAVWRRQLTRKME